MSGDRPHVIAAGEVRSLPAMHQWLMNVRDDAALSKDLREICDTLANRLNPVLEAAIIPAEISEKLWRLFMKIVCATSNSDLTCQQSKGYDQFVSLDSIASSAFGGVQCSVSSLK